MAQTVSTESKRWTHGMALERVHGLPAGSLSHGARAMNTPTGATSFASYLDEAFLHQLKRVLADRMQDWARRLQD